MTVRRQLLNFGGKSTDYRAGAGAVDELARMVTRTVAKPRRAVLVSQEPARALCGEKVVRTLVDAGFQVDEVDLPADGTASSFSWVPALLERFGALGITAEDAIVGAGDATACSLVALCAYLWCGGTSCILVPTTLEGMVTLATEMRGLDVPGGQGLVHMLPRATLVACDLDFLADASIEERGVGLCRLLTTYLGDSKRTWQKLDDVVGGLAAGEVDTYVTALFDAQTSRVNALKSASPSTRNALLFGDTTAAALRACLGGDLPDYLLLAEGMRFEARLAVDVADFAVDDVFKLDDRLEELGIGEATFELEPEPFIAALKAERFRRANRFMLPLPKRPGYIRLCAVDDEVLLRHAEAYLDSRSADYDDGGEDDYEDGCEEDGDAAAAGEGAAEGLVEA